MSGFSQEELEYLINLPEVLEAREKLSESRVKYFTIPLTGEIRSAIEEKLEIDLTGKTEVPMRWIRGDTPSHVDSGSSKFQKTHLAYLTDSEGQFVIGNESFPITANTIFSFNEGVQHRTEGTGSIPRLLLGPMNEFAEPVGSAMYYYANYADAISHATGGFVVPIAQNSNNFIVGAISYGSIGSYTSWRIAYMGTGVTPPTTVFSNGADLSYLNNVPLFLYPASPCFLEGTTVLCKVQGVETYLPIETIRCGTLVKTLDGFKKVDAIGKGDYHNSGSDERIEHRLYKCSVENYVQLKEDLYLTGCHSLLVDDLTEEQRENVTKSMGRIFVTDKKYRLPAHLDTKAEPWVSEGNYTIWNIALEHINPKMNYGIFVNGGLLVESCSLYALKEKSNLSLIN